VLGGVLAGFTPVLSFGSICSGEGCAHVNPCMGSLGSMGSVGEALRGAIGAGLWSVLTPKLLGWKALS